MTAVEERLIAALERSVSSAERTLATLAAIALAKHEAPVAVALPEGELVLVGARGGGARLTAPVAVAVRGHLVVVAEQKTFDTLIAQLREVKTASADLIAQLSFAT